MRIVKKFKISYILGTYEIIKLSVANYMILYSDLKKQAVNIDSLNFS